MRRAGVVLVALLAAGCGGGGEPGSTPTVRSESPPLPTATPTPASTPAPDPTASAPSAPAPPPDGGIPEGHGVDDLREGDEGDEQEIRTPVRFVVDGEGLTPPEVKVPAFLALRITIRNDLPRAIRVRGAGVRFRVPARGRRTVKAGGLQRGPHVVSAGLAGRASIVAE